MSMSESKPEWPSAPVELERIDGVNRLPTIRPQENDLSIGAGPVSGIAGDIVFDKKDPESLGAAVFTMMVRGETDARVIARTLGIQQMQVRALVAQVKNRFAEAAVEIRAHPEARKMALAARAEEITRMAMSQAMLSEDNVKHKFLALALRGVVEQAKLEGLDSQRVEVTEHKIDEKRTTHIVHKRIEDQLSRYGVTEDQAKMLSRTVARTLSTNIEARLKEREDVIDAEVVETTDSESDPDPEGSA